jgi:RNA polymerase sigma-70 factor (ECF subfamily)
LLVARETSIVWAVNRQARESRLRGLVSDHVDFVARVLRNLGTPPVEIDDAVQRTFIAVSTHVEEIRPGLERGYLFQVAVRVASHARRAQARRREVPLDDEDDEPVDLAGTPEHLTDEKRRREMLDTVLDAMPFELRCVFVLHEFEGLTMAEIAVVVDIAPGTVASRLRRARIDFRGRVRRLSRPFRAKVGS